MAVNDSLIARVIQQESGGNPNAVNPRTGASGLMQIMPATAADPGFGVQPLAWDQRFDPQANQRFGSDYLGAMLNRYDGDEARALVAYNWGVGNADKWNGDLSTLPAETRGYVQNILGGGAASYPIGSAELAAAQEPDALQRAMLAGNYSTGTEQAAQEPSALDLLASLGQQQPAQDEPQAAPQPQRQGRGYQKPYDSLSRALEQFQQTKAKRRS